MPHLCSDCSTTIQTETKFCPRCGRAVPASPTHQVVNFSRMSAPLPLAGILFFASLLLAPVAVVTGVLLSIKALIYFGLALVSILVLIAILASIS